MNNSNTLKQSEERGDRQFVRFVLEYLTYFKSYLETIAVTMAKLGASERIMIEKKVTLSFSVLNDVHVFRESIKALMLSSDFEGLNSSCSDDSMQIAIYIRQIKDLVNEHMYEQKWNQLFLKKLDHFQKYYPVIVQDHNLGKLWRARKVGYSIYKNANNEKCV